MLAESEAIALRPTERDRRSKSAARGPGFKWRAPARSVGRKPFKPETALLPEGRPWARSGSGVEPDMIQE